MTSACEQGRIDFSDHGPAHSGGDASIRASVQIRPHVAKLRALVLLCVAKAGERGATRDEIELESGLAGNTVRPRVVELLRSGTIRADGFRANGRGRKCEVLRLVTGGGA